MAINLIFNLYLDSYADRRDELIRTIEQNASTRLRLIPVIGPDFNRYNYNSIEWGESEKTSCVVIHKTIPMFDELFEIAAKNSSPDDINIIANMDIMFFEEDLKLIEDNLNIGECYALTRYEMVDKDPKNAKLWERVDSQDVWAFKGRPPKIHFPYFNGVPGCDNRLAYLIEQAGYKITNPSRSIKTYHNHICLKRNRNLDKTIPPPYKYLPPHFLDEELPEFDLDKGGEIE